jgi:hypothetical protein
VIVQKTKVATSIILAVLLAFLLFGFSYVLFPDRNPTPIPGPSPGTSLLDQIFWAILWIGLAAISAIVVVGVILLANRIRHRERLAVKDRSVNLYIAGVLQHSVTGMPFYFCNMLHRERASVERVLKSQKHPLFGNFVTKKLDKIVKGWM